jgi:hypothetical protein
MVIPSNWRDSRTFWERLTRFNVIFRTVHGRNLPFVVEPTRSGSVYACTVDDVATLLNLAPIEHVFGIQGVILRQPKRKEELLSPVWGRLAYAVNVGPISGVAILVEAVHLPLTLRWPTRLDLARQEELERLRLEADQVELNGRHHVLHFGLDSVRAVQLYRTILHELGHWVDYYEKVHVHSRVDDAYWTELRKAYFRRPVSERESFANRYASELAKGLRARLRLPFPRMWGPMEPCRSDFIWEAPNKAPPSAQDGG